jgi:vacuolar-type H+-ATPase subunit I/STV1
MMARVRTVVVPKPEFDDLVARVEELENLNHARFHEIERLLKATDVAEKNVEDRQAEVERLRGENINARHKAEVASTECAALHERLRDSEAEVERLRKRYEAWPPVGQSVIELRAEVERLRAKLGEALHLLDREGIPLAEEKE